MAVPPPPPPPTSTPEDALTVAPRTLSLSDADEATLDPRASRANPRPIAVLLAETRQLQSSMSATSDKAALLRPLAEDYVELAASSARDAQASETHELARARGAMTDMARSGAIAEYLALLQMPANKLTRDAVQFYLALEYARAGKSDEAQRMAVSVLQESPHSGWGERASLLLARLGYRPPTSSTTAVGVAIATPPTNATVCRLDMECPGVNVCRSGACIRP